MLGASHQTDTGITWTDIARSRQQARPEEIIFRFLDNKLEESATITYGSLDEYARRVGAYLQRQGEPGDRVLLLFSNGPEFITAFFACLYAGRIAVPIYPPQSRKPVHWRAVESILQDAAPVLVLTDGIRLTDVTAWLDQGDVGHRIVATALDAAIGDPDDWVPPSINSRTPAFLQYTSGSTSAPKGVIVTHDNLSANAALVKASFTLDEHKAVVSWLPHYHDMGLIGNMLHTFYAGAPSIHMSPMTFLSRPARWLQAIGRYRATTSGAPNFAYELCVSKVSEAEMASLDLSSWELAYLGAEPVRPNTLDVFARKFSACGFRRQAFFPCYGLAEATLFVAGADTDRRPVVTAFDKAALEDHRVKAIDAAGTASSPRRDDLQFLVSVGPVTTGGDVAIVDPHTSRRCRDDEVGEVWVCGPSIGTGYWRKPAETAETFGAQVVDEPPTRYLRTGDLGLIYEGELYITGRLKDLIIIRGRNHYPQDIEFTAQQSDPACEREAGAAFSIDHGGEERLVIVQEITRQANRIGDPDVIIGNVVQAISEQHEIQPYAVVLIKPGSLLKTTSGKVQRRRMKELYLNNELAVVGEFTTASAAVVKETNNSAVMSDIERDVARLWEEVLALPAGTISTESNFLDQGGDSLKAKEMLGRITEHYAVELPLGELFERPTVANVARLIEQSVSKPEASRESNAIGFALSLEEGTL